jgi:hypothetical protein
MTKTLYTDVFFVTSLSPPAQELLPLAAACISEDRELENAS